MSRAFLESIIHRPHRILGYRMRPYSFAVAAALDAAGEPLTTAPFRPADVLAYLKIASAKNPLAVRIRATWLDKWRAIRLLNPEIMRRTIEAIKDYEADYGSLPTLAQEVEGDAAGGIPSLKKSITAPWIASRVASLHLHTNLTDSEIWSIPIGYAIWLDASSAEARGAKVTFIDPDNPELDTDDLDELKLLATEPAPTTLTENPWVNPADVWGKKPERLIKPVRKGNRGGRKTRRGVDKPE